MKKKRSSNLFIILIFIVGLSLLLYPTISDYWNSFHQSRAVASYAEQVAKMDEKEYTELWKAAQSYNESLLDRSNQFVLTDEQEAQYEDHLNISGTGIMGYVEIPQINCTLPIYHGTDEAVLQIAIGHLEWTSLPVGGEGTHTVLSGHRGLPSAKLFTDLDDLVEGDTFMLRVLDEVLTYEVDKILIVEPQDTDALHIVEGKDYCTLVTCTPYGINTHRLLVRGHRVENTSSADTIRVTADAVQIDPMIVAPIVSIPILIVLLLIVIFYDRKPKRRGGDLW